METIQPIEALVPRRAQAFGEFVRRTAVLMRAGLPLPSGYAVARAEAEAFYASNLGPEEQISTWLQPGRPLLSEERAAALRARACAGALRPEFAEQLIEIFATLRSLGAQTVTVTAFLVCDKALQERPLGEVRLNIGSADELLAAVRDAYARLLDRGLIRQLRAADARDASVALLLQRMLDGLVSGIVYTRHPVTGDAAEWLVRTGYGLPSGVRLGRVASDVIRISRDGFVRDQVVAEKRRMLRANEQGQRELEDVAEPLVQRPCLTEAGLHEVLRVVARAERQVGSAVLVDWIISSGRVFLLRVEPLPGSGKPPRVRSQSPLLRERAMWSSVELGESLPLPPTPLSWSLLAKFSRGGLASALAAAGAALGVAPELLMDVRGRAYLNVGVLMEAVLRLPGMSSESLGPLGLAPPARQEPPLRAGPLDLARAALRLYDSHVRFGDELMVLSSRMADDRGHFAGLDARLLSPDAVERVLCDVEAFLGDASPALMRVYGNWLATLLALRNLLGHYLGDDALRVEKDLLWGSHELPSVESGYDLLRVGRTLARDSRALAWADSGGPVPAFVQEALDEFTSRHRQEGMLLLDPRSPRWRETPERLVGVMRALLCDPLSLAFAGERRELGKGRRERAEREWKRRVPLVVWPAVQLLLKRLRTLTRDRDKLLLDLAHGISVIRDISVDASRRLASRYPELGSDAAFFLELSELHAALARGSWDVSARVAMRRVEYGILAQLPRAAPRFQSTPKEERVEREPVLGVCGSAGATEGRILCVRDGSELASLPPGSILVVPACDVGLAAVLPAVRGVISEQGGSLSQGAALAHALGVPVVVGVAQALSRFQDGERVRLDADRARVERLR